MERLGLGIAPMIRVYVAAPFGRWSIAAGIGRALENMAPVRLVASWLDVASKAHGIDRLDSIEDARRQAKQNDRELEGAHVVLALGFPHEGREMFAEVRMAVEYGIPVVWCGPTYLTAMREGVVRIGKDVMRADWHDAVNAVAAAARLVAARGLGEGEDPVYTRELVRESLMGTVPAVARVS